jgi:hypothetical protein
VAARAAACVRGGRGPARLPQPGFHGHARGVRCAPGLLLPPCLWAAQAAAHRPPEAGPPGRPSQLAAFFTSLEKCIRSSVGSGLGVVVATGGSTYISTLADVLNQQAGGWLALATPLCVCRLHLPAAPACPCLSISPARNACCRSLPMPLSWVCAASLTCSLHSWQRWSPWWWQSAAT